MAEPLLVARDVVVAYGGPRRFGQSAVRPVLHGVSLQIGKGDTVGIVGVLGKRIRALQLESPTKATVQSELQRVILRSAVGGYPKLELSDVRISRWRVGREIFAPIPDFRRQGVISVVAVELMIGMGAGISQGDRRL